MQRLMSTSCYFPQGTTTTSLLAQGIRGIYRGFSYVTRSYLLNSPFVEPAGIDQLLDNLLLERHPYTVAQANDGSGSFEVDKAYIKIATLKNAALLASGSTERLPGCLAHLPRTSTCGI
jgi:hypothetical protein